MFDISTKYYSYEDFVENNKNKKIGYPFEHAYNVGHQILDGCRNDAISYLKGKYDKFNILDVGGSYGIHYEEMKGIFGEEIGNSINRYDIIENKGYLDKLKEKNKNLNKIRHFDSEQILEDNYHFLFSNSGIQYIDNSIEWLENFVKYNKDFLEFIVFQRFLITDEKSFIGTQSYMGCCIPYWFLNLEEIDNIMKIANLNTKENEIKNEYGHTICMKICYSK